MDHPGRRPAASASCTSASVTTGRLQPRCRHTPAAQRPRREPSAKGAGPKVIKEQATRLAGRGAPSGGAPKGAPSTGAPKGAGASCSPHAARPSPHAAPATGAAPLLGPNPMERGPPRAPTSRGTVLPDAPAFDPDPDPDPYPARRLMISWHAAGAATNTAGAHLDLEAGSRLPEPSAPLNHLLELKEWSQTGPCNVLYAMTMLDSFRVAMAAEM